MTTDPTALTGETEGLSAVAANSEATTAAATATTPDSAAHPRMRVMMNLLCLVGLHPLALPAEVPP